MNLLCLTFSLALVIKAAAMEAGQANPQTTRVGVEPDDRTGRSRLVFNVLFTWAGQMVYFVAGFVMPRLIDHKLGQEVLGVWDFCWSLVAYFRFVDMGIASSINRYVGRCWGKRDIEGINRVVSSATAAFAVTGVIILLVTTVVVLALPHWFGAKLDEYVGVTQKSVFCLGVMLSFAAVLGAFNGVLTGCHRWELQTLRNTGWYFVSVIGMIVALWLGGGLVTLAVITAVCNICAHITLVGLAYRACPGLRLRLEYIGWSTIKELYAYGGKTLLPTISEMLLNQTASLLVIGSLGPGKLAVFTRPRSLLRQMDTMERKMAMILVPTTSSLDANGQREQIEKLMVKSVRYSVYLVLPLVFVLVIFGGDVMRLWMGRDYANWALPAVLALGFLGNSIQTPIFSVLSGLNVHGRAGTGQLAGAAAAAVSVFVTLKLFHAGLAAAAVAITLPLMVVNLYYLPMLLCRHLGQSLKTFYRDVAVRPLRSILPFTVCLGVGRLLVQSHLVLGLTACAAGGVMLLFSYWKEVLPNQLKSKIRTASEKTVRLLDVRLAGIVSLVRNPDRNKPYAPNFAIGTFLLAVVFLIPDASRAAQRSFVAVAMQSPWGHVGDWSSAWCSTKIILLALALIVFLEVILFRLMKTRLQLMRVFVFASAVVPMMLAVFGFYELAKAIF